jgi:exocyst complex component 7
LEEFTENVHGDSSSQLPSDGTVHELTSNVLMFLEQLTDYTDTIGSILVAEPAYAHALASAPGRADKNRTLLGIYISTFDNLYLVQLHKIGFCLQKKCWPS